MLSMFSKMIMEHRAGGVVVCKTCGVCLVVWVLVCPSPAPPHTQLKMTLTCVLCNVSLVPHHHSNILALRMEVVAVAPAEINGTHLVLFCLSRS